MLDALWIWAMARPDSKVHKPSNVYGDKLSPAVLAVTASRIPPHLFLEQGLRVLSARGWR
jgi:hypothetical protein